MNNVRIVELKSENLIKLVRRYKQLTNAANTNAANGDMGTFDFWTRKANIKMHELRRAMNLPPYVDVVTMQGTTKEIILIGEENSNEEDNLGHSGNRKAVGD
jgi:hypothetical protein